MNLLRRRWPWALALLLAWASLGLYGYKATDLVRLRNALHFDALPPVAFEWTPASVPRDFLLERREALPVFVDVARGLRRPDPWDSALRIGRHLLGSAPQLQGGGLRDDLVDSYRAIVDRGEGYCADFVRVFEGLATAAGLTVRRWSFSFDGYGGHGHQLVEVWTPRGWQLLDVFNNIYFVDADDKPLSALALVQRLGRGETLRSKPIEPRARPGYTNPVKQQAYFARGAAQWYLAWGSNPFTRNQMVEALGPLRPVAQLMLIARGELPRPRALALPVNEAARARMQRIRWHLLIVLGLTPVFLLGFAWPRAYRGWNR